MRFEAPTRSFVAAVASPIVPKRVAYTADFGGKVPVDRETREICAAAARRFEELGSVVEVHKSNRPAMNADARYNRALARLNTGDVDQALAETMRLPGASRADDWTNKARRYVAAHRALDEIESAALLGGQGR